MRSKALKKKRPTIDKSKLKFGTRKRLIDDDYLNSFKGVECIVPGCFDRETVCGCHIRDGLFAIGTKPDDSKTLPLCAKHHAEQHRIGEKAFYAKYLCWTIKQAVRAALERYEAYNG